VTEIFGYNNNICMGSINTLYYCTLYTSKSNQEDETYPYLKALEAVASRLRRVQQYESENDISQRQIGLRHLLSGISSHISSCVISATMAWYLVQHGTRFHFSHEFKPLLLTQFEAWYKGEIYSQRIRHRSRKKKTRTSNRQSNQTTADDGSEDETEVWMDSSVNNYINRPPDDSLFDNMCLWEYESKYDMVTQRPETFMTEDLPCDESKLHYRFNREHSGFNYCCLYKRPNECIPKLYCSNSIPDIELLELEKEDNVEEHTLALREVYALKAMLLFYPFLDKADILGNHECLWQSFTYQKTRLIHHITTGEPIQPPHLYLQTLQILQNIQDLINIKKIPKADESLQVCTTLNETEPPYDMSGTDFEDQVQGNHAVDDNFDEDVQIHHLTDCVNLLSENMSIFNNNNEHTQRNISYASHPSIVSLQSTSFENIHDEHHNLITQDNEDDLMQGRASNVQQGFNAVSNTFISILTKALETVNGELFRPQISSTNEDMESIHNSITSAILSLEEYALQQNLDNKQKIAFKAICASFMFSFLTEMSGEISTVDMQQLTLLLQRNGAVQQLLMCVTGPGGSGKSHVIKCSRMYCKMFCDAISKPFNFSVFPITATTNAAAALLQGCTIHSAALLNKKVVQIEIGCDVNWPMTKILIIDEISMATSSLFKSLDKNLRILTGNRRLLYGGIHIVFTGDFMQLAPVQGTPIYQNFDDYFWHQCLNSAVFLDERNHRFINDPLWGEILQRCQLGVPTEQDINTVNERVLGTAILPNNVNCNETKLVYGCYTNKKRNQITDACFFKYVSCNSPSFHSSEDSSSAILIIKGIVTKQNKDVGPEFHKLLWALCGDDNLTVGNSCKVDPCLKLIEGIPLMVNTNTGKENRIVKGIIGNFVGVIWKHQCNAHVENYHGYKVNCAYISDIEYIVLRLHVDGRLVYISPEMFHPIIKFPGCNNMNVLKGYTIQQFPVNVSLAITGHKLQGMTVDILILSEIHLTQNWLYVLLSRVTSLNGLYLMKPLKCNMFKPISQNLRRELEWLRGLETMLINRINNI
ncbi:MAG: AAA family ATPase, partial [bacterium]